MVHNLNSMNTYQPCKLFVVSASLWKPKKRKEPVKTSVLSLEFTIGPSPFSFWSAFHQCILMKNKCSWNVENTSFKDSERWRESTHDIESYIEVYWLPLPKCKASNTLHKSRNLPVFSLHTPSSILNVFATVINPKISKKRSRRMINKNINNRRHRIMEYAYDRANEWSHRIIEC